MHSSHSELNDAGSSAHSLSALKHVVCTWCSRLRICMLTHCNYKWGALACSCPKSHAYTGPVWHMILYADGITPGGVLVPDNRRKCVVWYASFLELRSKLAYEEAWTCLAIARTYTACTHTHAHVHFAFLRNCNDHPPPHSYINQAPACMHACAL